MEKSIHAQHRQRMRSRFKESGGKGFHDHELLEMLLFYAIPVKNTNDIAHRLIDKFGTFEKISSASIPELMLVDGIGESVAVYLKLLFEYHNRMLCQVGKNQVFHTFEEIGDHFMKLFMHKDVETMILILFDKKGRIDRTISVATGDFVEAKVDMKALISSAISESAHTAAVAHNHLTGVLNASLDDRYATVQIEDILRTFNIKLIDHYIVSETGYIGVKRHSVTE